MNQNDIKEAYLRVSAKNKKNISMFLSALLSPINPIETPPVQPIENTPTELPKPIPKESNPIKVKLLCNWTTSEILSNIWKKMSQNNQGKWNNLQLTQSNPDFYVIINAHGNPDNYTKEKTLIFHMEPNIDKSEIWGEFKNPQGFLKVYSHKDSLNIA